MKETGLMFKAPLVRAILSGQKTQTRRIAKLPHMNPLGVWEPTTIGGPGGGRTRDGKEVALQVAVGHTRTGDVICAPIQAGDRIYVRETWCQQADDDGCLLDGAYWYRATTPDVMHSEDMEKSPWRPSIHMPKHAARIWLEVTGVRVERLQSITEADCIAEGAHGGHGSIPGYGYNATPMEHFCHIWDSTTGRPALPENKNSKRYARVKHWLDTHPDTVGWSANPWVWVIDFKTISTIGRPA